MRTLLYSLDSRVRRHLQFANHIDNLTATHRPHKGESNRVFARGERNRVFSINQNWEANIVAKTWFLICARGSKKLGFFDKLKRGSKDCGKNLVSDFRLYMAARIPMMI